MLNLQAHLVAQAARQFEPFAHTLEEGDACAELGKRLARDGNRMIGVVGLVDHHLHHAQDLRGILFLAHSAALAPELLFVGDADFFQEIVLLHIARG